ncbi:hypothetical protein ACWC2H_44935, partial [Streptomyces sp. 900105755]
MAAGPVTADTTCHCVPPARSPVDLRWTRTSSVVGAVVDDGDGRHRFAVDPADEEPVGVLG